MKPHSQGNFGYLIIHRRGRQGHATIANASFPGNGPISPKEIEITSLSNSTITLDHIGVLSKLWVYVGCKPLGFSELSTFLLESFIVES